MATSLLPRRQFGFGVVTCLGLVAVAAAAQSGTQPDAPPAGASDPAPTKVTSDSPEFCSQLADQLQQEQDQHKAVPREVVSLTEEGRRMCGQGQVRPGIFRLRRAFQILQGER